MTFTIRLNIFIGLIFDISLKGKTPLYEFEKIPIAIKFGADARVPK